MLMVEKTLTIEIAISVALFRLQVRRSADLKAVHWPSCRSAVVAAAAAGEAEDLLLAWMEEDGTAAPRRAVVGCGGGWNDGCAPG